MVATGRWIPRFGRLLCTASTHLKAAGSSRSVVSREAVAKRSVGSGRARSRSLLSACAALFRYCSSKLSLSNEN
ncbi:hypothetical protein EYF80_019871 [Liparis tanakae]|uniref:Uncharacterized protein n=1 Tax=Liparis tanakae TaxID=230148 RepID=A0A4Z2HWE2_9TELE|nr:hypothetical protein EYF80_019871 [Liparis tanakae]